ncbi:hypothetical protein J3R82DRAFT_5207 [Butyriboletus roseoflavus]|nr:hypothetical protein J3R82DRAFT_5207 [Butyriboletus roseoflavus]
MESRRNTIRVEFSTEHDSYLYKYLARYCPSHDGRKGQKIFQRLVANENNTWPWSVHHTWQSWRERYVRNTDRFDALILNYQRKHNVKSTEGSKRAAEPITIEMLGPTAKRARLEKAPVRHAQNRVRLRNTQSHARRNLNWYQSALASLWKRRIRRHTANPNLDRRMSGRCLYRVSITIRILMRPRSPPSKFPASLNQPVPIAADGEPHHRSSPRAVKRIQKRRRTPSEVFASEPSSPRRDPAVVNVGSAPVTDAVYPRAPPRVVDSLHGQTLVDERGYVPRAFPHGEEDVAEEEKEQEENARWPPLRGHTAKQRTVSRPGNEVNTHHAFSQTQPQPRPEASQEGMAMAEREQGKPHHLFGQVSRRLDQCTVATLFSAELNHGVAPQVTGERREDITRNGTSPFKRIIGTAPASALLSGLIPNPVSKAFNFPCTARLNAVSFPARASSRGDSPSRSPPAITDTGSAPSSTEPHSTTNHRRECQWQRARTRKWTRTRAWTGAQRRPRCAVSLVHVRAIAFAFLDGHVNPQEAVALVPPFVCARDALGD